MRGFHSEEEASKVVTQKTIEEYTKMITRETFVQNYSYAFSVALEALENYGEVPQIIQLARDLVDRKVKFVMSEVPEERKIPRYGWWKEFLCNKKYNITNDWIIDTAIAWGYKNIRRDSLETKDKVVIDTVRIDTFMAVNYYAIMQTELCTTIQINNNNCQEKMLKAIGYGLINLAIQESKK